MAFGAFLLAVCVWLFNVTGTFFSPPNPVAPPAMWPRIIIVLLGVLAIALIVTNLIAHINEIKAAKEKGIELPKADIMGIIYEKRKVLGAMAVTLVFLFTFVPVGFVITCVIYFVVITYILEPSKDHKVLITRVVQAIVLVILIYFVFMRGLNVQLPTGIMPAQWFR